jgi:hypothetical protein
VPPADEPDAAVRTERPIERRPAERHTPFATPADGMSATEVPVQGGRQTPSTDEPPAAPRGSSSALPTASASPRDGLRIGTPSPDAGMLATLLIIALVLVRWSRREDEHRYSPVFLSLAERPG